MMKEKTSKYRKLAIYGFDSVNNGHNFFGLLEFDITNLRSILRAKRINQSGGSLFAFILKVIGKCLQDYPEFNSMVNSKYTTTFDEVDINIPIEIDQNSQKLTKQLIIRNVNSKSLSVVDQEIYNAKKNEDNKKGFVSSDIQMNVLSFLPRFVVKLIFKIALLNHEMVKKLSGTVFVTSVSMFSNVPGYIIPYSGGPKAVSFAIGSSVKKPVVFKNEIVIREMLNITIIFNHDNADGAQSARFINQLRNYIEVDYEKIL